MDHSTYFFESGKLEPLIPRIAFKPVFSHILQGRISASLEHAKTSEPHAQRFRQIRSNGIPNSESLDRISFRNRFASWG